MLELTAELKDSSLLSVLTRPWLINKVTCGSMVTILDTSSEDVMVTVDICLIALLLANIILFFPVIFSDLDAHFGDSFDQLHETLDRDDSPLNNLIDIANVDDAVMKLQNMTNFEAESLLDYINIEKPLAIMKDIRTILRNITEEMKAKDEFEKSLNVARVPIDVYKFPQYDPDPYDSVFAGFEAVKDEVIDLSGFTKNDKISFYELPRSAPENHRTSLFLLKKIMKVLSSAVKIEKKYKE